MPGSPSSPQAPASPRPFDPKRYKDDPFVQQHLKEIAEVDKQVKAKKAEVKKLKQNKEEKLTEKQKVNRRSLIPNK